MDKANVNAIWMNTEHANILLVYYQLYSPELMYIQDRMECCKFDFLNKVWHNRIFKCQITIASKVRKKNFHVTDSKISLTITSQSVVEYNYGYIYI